MPRPPDDADVAPVQGNPHEEREEDTGCGEETGRRFRARELCPQAEKDDEEERRLRQEPLGEDGIEDPIRIADEEDDEDHGGESPESEEREVEPPDPLALAEPGQEHEDGGNGERRAHPRDGVRAEKEIGEVAQFGRDRRQTGPVGEVGVDGGVDSEGRAVEVDLESPEWNQDGEPAGGEGDRTTDALGAEGPEGGGEEGREEHVPLLTEEGRQSETDPGRESESRGAPSLAATGPQQAKGREKSQEHRQRVLPEGQAIEDKRGAESQPQGGRGAPGPKPHLLEQERKEDE